MRISPTMALLPAAVLLWSSWAVAQTEELVTLPTRPGVTQSFLLDTVGDQPPQAVVVLFTGTSGVLHLRKDGDLPRIGTMASNFLVRSRNLFVSSALAVAVPDAPSDQQDGMNNQFRSGAAHLKDLGTLVGYLKQKFPGAKVFLIGTSMGTISAAWVGRSLGQQVDGVVLTSTVFRANRRTGEQGLQGFDFGSIGVPTLLVHNHEDQCPVCPYGDAQVMAQRYRLPLVTVHGGSPPQSGPCDALSYHGYLGKEQGTVQAILDWISGHQPPSDVE